MRTEDNSKMDILNISDLIAGVYFKSESDVSTEYLVELNEGKFEGNALIKIYRIEDILDDSKLEIGSFIKVSKYDAEWLIDLDLCGKYFFPKFNNELQLYYDEYKYYNSEYKTNSIMSMFEAIDFAIEYGLSKSGIKPY